MYIGVLQRTSVAEKISCIADMIGTAQMFLRAGLRQRYPAMGEWDEHARLLDLWFGSNVAAAVKQAACTAHGARKERAAMQTALDVLLHVIDVLDALRIPYLLGGSWASMAYGVPRATQDADLLVQLNAAQVGALVAALEDSFYVSEEAIRDALARHASFNVIPLGVAFKVDLFVAGPGPYAASQMARRVPHEISSEPRHVIFLAAPEDTILTKLLWYRQGNEASEQQWRDVLGVLRVQEARLDGAYLERWAATLGIGDLLRRALAETGIVEGHGQE
jgi:hypothetical protein